MKTKWLLLLSLFTFGLSAAERPWRYQLLEGSLLTDECLICDRITIPIPMRGTFDLRRGEVSPIAQKYLIENAEFKAGPDYTFKGSGTYDMVGDFAVRQVVTLTGTLETPNGTNKVAFTNETSSLTRRWPMLQFGVVQTNGTLLSTITLDIAAAPLREIWFSTRTNFIRAIRLDNTVSDGDLLSTAGHIVKRNSDLQHFPGPTYENMGLDALAVLPGEGIVFSTSTLGFLSDGDFAYERTGLVGHWQDFMSEFATSDPGLDGLQEYPLGGWCFSIKTNSGTWHHGDILHPGSYAQGPGVWKRNADLLAQFHPDQPKDFGLDAFYLWPGGNETWFSTSEGFNDSQLGPISDGDLLSDAGYIVYRNSDLTAALQPVGDPPTNFGLDAITVVSDFDARTDGVTLKITLELPNNQALFSWTGNARFFQLERANNVMGPWEPWSPIVADASHSEAVALEHFFYRLRQW